MDKALQKPRYVSQRIQYAAGVTGIQKTEVTLDKSYDFCDGIAVFYVNSTSTPADFTIGLSDKTGVIQDRTIAKEWTCGQDVPHKLRYKDVLIEAKGDKATILIESIPAGGFSAAVDIYVIFRLKS